MCVLLTNLPLFQIYGNTGRYIKHSTLWTIPAYPFGIVFWRLLCSHGTVCTYIFMPQYNCSHKNVLVCSIRDSPAHKDVLFVNFRISFHRKIRFHYRKEIHSRDLSYMSRCVFLSVQNQSTRIWNSYLNYCPLSYFYITTIFECDMYQVQLKMWRNKHV